jgi:hypothetical protein
MNLAGMWRGWMAAVLVAGLGVVACGLDKPEPWLGDEEPPAFSAANLGKGPVTADMLTPAEREALARERGAAIATGDEVGVSAEDEDPFNDEEDGEEKTGKLALSLLTVGLSLAAAAAPYLLF